MTKPLKWLSKTVILSFMSEKNIVKWSDITFNAISWIGVPFRQITPVILYQRHLKYSKITSFMINLFMHILLLIVKTMTMTMNMN